MACGDERVRTREPAVNEDKYQDEVLTGIIGEVEKIGIFKMRLGDLKEEIRKILLNAYDAGYDRAKRSL